MQYRCAHCLALLGPFVPDEPEPRCTDHPDGAVELIGRDDDQ